MPIIDTSGNTRGSDGTDAGPPAQALRKDPDHRDDSVSPAVTGRPHACNVAARGAIVAALGLLGLPGAAVAQSDPMHDLLGRLRECSANQGAVQRLDCFDSLARSATAGPPADAGKGTGKPGDDAAARVQPEQDEPRSANPPAGNGAAAEAGPSVGKWEILRSVDEMTDKPIVIATLTESLQLPVKDRVLLSIRCKENRTELYINWKADVGTSGAIVIYRLDQKQPQRQFWFASTDGKASFAPQAMAFVKEAQHRRQAADRGASALRRPGAGRIRARRHDRRPQAGGRGLQLEIARRHAPRAGRSCMAVLPTLGS